MQPLPAIDTIPIFEEIQAELISLLKSLSDDEWYYDTTSSTWNVKDIVAHLLDGDLRRLSLHRDRHRLPESSGPIDDYQSLVTFLNELNNTWVTAARRLSPTVLVDLIEHTTPQVIDHFNRLDPEGTALFSVGWAGEDKSENWFDLAREYTEKWHHQQQIREATDRPLLTERKWLAPLISTLIRGVPPVFNKHAHSATEDIITINISGVIDDRWLLAKTDRPWQLYKGTDKRAGTTIEMDDDTAWRLFTKNISGQKALERIQFTGNRELGSLIAKTVSYMK